MWTASLDDTAPKITIEGVVYPAGAPNPRPEHPNWVGYYTLSHPDGRTKKWRHAFDALGPGEPELSLADICALLDNQDQRMADMAQVIAGRTFTPGPVTFPDRSKQRAVETAKAALRLKLSGALLELQVVDAVAVDPTVADAKAAYDAAVQAAK